MRGPGGQAGATLVEVAVGLSIAGTLLAVAVPAFVRHLEFSRMVEPVDGLRRLGASAIAYARGRPPSDAFPPSVPMTPSPAPRGERQVDPPDTWNHPTWQALHFRAVPEGVPHFFSFSFESTRSPGQSRFTARAHGDLDGNGTTSLFELRGQSTQASPPTLEPGIYVEGELE